ncbi:hypothetical protein ACWTQZ_26330, partial [Escherichia coli]
KRRHRLLEVWGFAGLHRGDPVAGPDRPSGASGLARVRHVYSKPGRSLAGYGRTPQGIGGCRGGTRGGAPNRRFPALAACGSSQAGI